MLNVIRALKNKIMLQRNTDDAELEYRLSRGMKIGKNCHIYSTGTIDATWPWLISMGDNVTISTNVTILAHDASPNMVGCGTKLGKVRIGSNVFIGTGSTILCNTEIGDNVVIGAGSVVTHSLPSNGVYAGVPARRVCSIEEYRDKCKKLRAEKPDLSRIRPWNQWNDASDEEKKRMIQEMGNDMGFI